MLTPRLLRRFKERNACFSSNLCPVVGCTKSIVEGFRAHDRAAGGTVVCVCIEHDYLCTATLLGNCTCPEIDPNKTTRTG